MDNKYYVRPEKFFMAAKEYAASVNDDPDTQPFDGMNAREFAQMAFSPVCCGFGHRDYFPSKYEEELQKTVVRLYEKNKVCRFLTGGMGAFDRAFASAVRYLKRDHRQVILHLVLPYYSNRFNKSKSETEYLKELYDEIYIPDVIAGTHYKSAITQRNRWLVDNSDYVISAVMYDYGGAYQSVKYAEKSGKKLINIAHH